MTTPYEIEYSRWKVDSALRMESPSPHKPYWGQVVEYEELDGVLIEKPPVGQWMCSCAVLGHAWNTGDHHA